MLGQITQLGVDSEHTKREANCAYLMISIGSIFIFCLKVSVNAIIRMAHLTGKIA